jgi:hypothetical protein
VDHMTPDRWLYDLHMALRPWFRDAGYPVPGRVSLHMGFPKGARRTGESWHLLDIEKGQMRHRVFVAPTLDDPIDVGNIVVQELVHACVTAEAHAQGAEKMPPPHGKRFKTVCAAVGIAAPVGESFSATFIDDGTHGTPGWPKGKALRQHLEQITARMPPYPHKAWERPHKQKAVREKWLPLECGACRLEVRITEFDVESAEELQCPRPECSGPLEKPEKE